MKPPQIIFQISNLYTRFCGSGLKKYALVFFVFHFSFFVAQAQTLVAADFVGFTNCGNTGCFEDKIIAHGYTPVMYGGGSNIFAEPGGTNCAENSVGYVSKGISYTTINVDRYKELMAEFAALGFSGMLKVGKEGSTVSRSPKQNGVTLTIITYKATDKCGMPKVGYNITVERK